MKEDFYDTQHYAFVENGQRHVWRVRRLWELSVELPVFDFDIEDFTGMDIDMWFCGVNVPTVRSVYDHCMRIQQADLSFPILLDAKGVVLDGVHRILKAKTLGLPTVQARRFETLPAPDRVEAWPVVDG